MRRLARSQRLRSGAAHRVRTAVDRVLARLAGQRADISGELPDLVFGELAPPRRHAVRPTFGDARRDLIDAPAVALFVVHQRRTHAAAAMAVAADAIHLHVERLALRDRGRIVVVEFGARIGRLRRRSAWPDRVGAFARRNRLADRLGAAVALLAVAPAERERRDGKEDEASAAA